jgi:hypothetical protein
VRLLKLANQQVATGNYDDVIARLFDMFREYDEGLENPAGASFGSSKPQSSKGEGKRKEVDRFSADEIQESQGEEDFEDECSDESFEDPFWDVLDLKPSTGKVVRLSKEKSEKTVKRFVGTRNLYDKNLQLGISCDETDEIFERGEFGLMTMSEL